MSNKKQNHIVDSNKMVTAVEWLSNKAYELFEQYSEGKFDRITLNKLMLEATDKAKEMEKEQIENAYEIGFADAWDDARYDDEPTYIGAEQYYKETYEK